MTGRKCVGGRLLFALFFLFMGYLVVGSDEKGNLTTSLHGKVVVPDGGKKNQAQTKKDVGNMEVILNGGERTTMTTISGDFAFYEVPAGVYALDVNDIEYTFSQLKIKVSFDDASNGGESDGDGDSDGSESSNSVNSVPKITVIEYKYPGAQKVAGSYPLVLTALAKNNYLPVKEGLNLFKMILGNPMALMMLFSVGIVVGMPMMMKNMDPEELKAMQERSSLNPAEDPAALMKKFMGMDTKDDEDD